MLSNLHTLNPTEGSSDHSDTVLGIWSYVDVDLVLDSRSLQQACCFLGAILENREREWCDEGRKEEKGGFYISLSLS